MKTALLLLLASTSAHAVDTSGCSQLRETASQPVATAQGNEVRATLRRAPRAGCWNEKDASLTVQYRFAGQANADVTLVTLVNGQKASTKAQVSCGGGIGYGKDTSGNATQACTAVVVVAAPSEGAINLEVAPVVNGNWDTAGEGRNATIRL